MRRSLRDVQVANTLLGGSRAVEAELEPALDELARLGTTSATLLDVGTGLGDIPRRARTGAMRKGIALRVVGLDGSEVLAHAACGSDLPCVCGDARDLPFERGAVDFVLCSQLLHHFDCDDAARVLRELDRVARFRVIIGELRRSWLAAAGIWIASFPLAFHPVSRHDGVVSVMRGFTRQELGTVVRQAVGVEPHVRRRLGYRLTASWRPSGDPK